MAAMRFHITYFNRANSTFGADEQQLTFLWDKSESRGAEKEEPCDDEEGRTQTLMCQVKGLTERFRPDDRETVTAWLDERPPVESVQRAIAVLCHRYLGGPAPGAHARAPGAGPGA